MPPDPRCDLFSLGVVMYEMATGRLPFAAASPADTVTNVLEKDPPAVQSVAPDRSPKLSRIIERLLAKNPDDRYQTAAELRETLRTLTAHDGDDRPLWQRFFGR
jgi:serine/threonine-protein kinase